MKITKSQRHTIFLLVIILIMIIPQTRQPIQILLHKGLTLFSPSVVDEKERITITDYNWELVDEHGNSFDFNTSKGKVTIVNFWATWCPPCIAEMPSLEKLYQNYKNDVVFLLVSNEDQELILKFKKRNDYDFLVYSSKTMPPEILKTSSIPRTYVIDKNGTIVIDKSGAADWNSEKVKEVINSLLE